jgi:hypothetical protein
MSDNTGRIMSFIALKNKGKDLILNTDRIISVSFDEGTGQTTITCTDQYSVHVDNAEDDVRKRLGVKKEGEKTIGF